MTLATCRRRTCGRAGTARALGRASGASGVVWQLRISMRRGLSGSTDVSEVLTPDRAPGPERYPGPGLSVQRERDRAKRCAGAGAAGALRQRPSGDETRRKRAVGSGRSTGTINSALAAGSAVHSSEAWSRARRRLPGAGRAGPAKLPAGRRPAALLAGSQPAGSGLAEAAAAAERATGAGVLATP